MALPIFNSPVKELSLMQTQWATQINPVIQNPANKSLLLKDVSLSVGDNVINHRLGRTPQGWKIIDINGVSDIYRSASLNDLTLTLNSSAAVTVSLEIF